MTRHGPALLALSIIAVASWSYNVNYDTRAALERLAKLRAEMAEQREALQVLRVEWAFLNAPLRLERLVARHNDLLGLVPLVPEGLGIVAAIPYPPRETPDTAPFEPDALIAAAEPPAPLLEAAPVEAVAHAGGFGPGNEALAVVEPASWRPAAAMPPEGEVESVPAALEAAIDAALAKVGVPPEDEGSGVVSVPAATPAGIFAVAGPGVPLPAARSVAWSGR